MQDASERQALLNHTFYDTPLPNQIIFSGDATTFTVNLVRKLDTYGHISIDKTAIAMLLEALQSQLGIDQQQKIESFIDCIEENTHSSSVTLSIPDLPEPQNVEAREHIFISYASADRISFVDRLAKDLANVGYKVWVDNLDTKYGGIVGGMSWQQELANALNYSALVIFVITPDSIRSQWVQAELKRASESKRPIIGVIARPLMTKDDRDLFGNFHVGKQPFSDLHYRDFIKRGYDRGMHLLKSDIRKHFPNVSSEL